MAPETGQARLVHLVARRGHHRAPGGASGGARAGVSGDGQPIVRRRIRELRVYLAAVAPLVQIKRTRSDRLLG